MIFSSESAKRLRESHPDLQRLFNEVIKTYDCSVICGYRSKVDQDKAFLEGKSKNKYPTSKHNLIPSMAVDVVPYPIDWTDLKRMYHFAGFVKGIASVLGIKIRSGCDWDNDNDFNDQTFNDLPHFELIGD